MVLLCLAMRPLGFRFEISYGGDYKDYKVPVCDAKQFNRNYKCSSETVINF